MHIQPNISLLLLFFLLCLFPFIGIAQNNNAFDTTGNNIEAVSCSEVVFRGSGFMDGPTARVRANGTAWYKQKLDLSQPFDMGFFIQASNLAAPDGDRFLDGFSFVLQAADNTQAGVGSNGMGYGGITPSVAVTFDMKKDTVDADPAFEHVSIQTNGNTNHQSAQNLTSPVNISGYIINIAGPTSPEPLYVMQGYCNIIWNPTTKTLTVYFNNVVLTSVTYDLAAQLFNNSTEVTWGFTSSQTFATYTPGGAADFRLPIVRFYFGYIKPAYITDVKLDTCYGKPIRFIDNSSYDQNDIVNSLDVARYYWDFGNGQTSTERNPPLQHYPGPGNYNLKFAVTNQIGCTVDTLEKIIQLGSKPIPDFNIEGFCQGNPTFLTDKTTIEVGRHYASFWTFNGNVTSVEKDPVVQLANAGVQTVSLRVQSTLGCLSDFIEKTIIVQESPKVDFTFNQDCFGHVSYQSHISNSVNGAVWQWHFGDGSSSLLQQPHHTYAINDTFFTSLYITSAIGCRSDTIIKSIPVYKVFADAGRDTILAQGQPLRLNAVASSNDIKWSPSTNISDPFHPNPIVTLQQDATFILQVQNTNGCIAKDTITIKVFEGPQVYVPNAFTPNGDGLNDVIKPIIPGLYKMQNFTIYNRWGQKVYETADVNKGWTGWHNGQLLPGEVYIWFVRMTDYTGEPMLKKGTILLIR